MGGCLMSSRLDSVSAEVAAESGGSDEAALTHEATGLTAAAVPE